MASGLTNIFRVPELRKRLVFSLGMLAVYRLGIFVTTPGVDRKAMGEIVRQGNLLGLLNFFSGGALEQLSIFALGIMPYVSASIILQLLTVVVPALEKLQKEGELGRRKITQYTRYLTIVLSAIQGYGIASYLESLRTNAGLQVVAAPGWGFRLLTMISLAAGTAFIMWMGEQITERGIGNGISLVIFAGIVARAPAAAYQTFMAYRSPGSTMSELGLVILGVVMLVVIGAIVFVERGQRRIPIQYAKRVVGRKLYGGQSTHLPLKVNTSGVIPPIFASSLLLFPATLAGWFPFLTALQTALNPGTWIYNTLYVLLIVFFAYFYTAVTFNPVDVADNLKKYGGYIPGIRPGKKTADYIDHVLSRITFGGAMYLAAICVLPTIITDEFGVTFYFGGTSLLIVVGVALDTVQQIEGHLITRHYEGFTGPRGPRIRGRTVTSGQPVGA
ncbi:MAG: preprotein translocase subunit SecY [Anaeromyxobacteraceae bacterium]|nr:preprotein translocase subunit SecY [Anaeromyxobacteraceae bacterium]